MPSWSRRWYVLETSCACSLCSSLSRRKSTTGCSYAVDFCQLSLTELLWSPAVVSGTVFLSVSRRSVCEFVCLSVCRHMRWSYWLKCPANSTAMTCWRWWCLLSVTMLITRDTTTPTRSVSSSSTIILITHHQPLHPGWSSSPMINLVIRDDPHYPGSTSSTGIILITRDRPHHPGCILIIHDQSHHLDDPRMQEYLLCVVLLIICRVCRQQTLNVVCSWTFCRSLLTILIPHYNVSEKPDHFINSQHLLIVFGTEIPYSILHWLRKKFLNWLRTNSVVSITTVATWHTWTEDFWADFEQHIIDTRQGNKRVTLSTCWKTFEHVVF